MRNHEMHKRFEVSHSSHTMHNGIKNFCFYTLDDLESMSTFRRKKEHKCDNECNCGVMRWKKHI